MVRKLSTVVAGLVVVAASLAYLVVFVQKPPKPPSPRWVRIPPSPSVDAVTDSLMAQEMLIWRWAFLPLARATGWGTQIKPGCYEFSHAATPYQLLRRLRAGEQTVVPVRIPSGSHPNAVARVASRNMVFDDSDFLAALNDSTLAADLGTKPRHLFGHMLPDTYHFYCNESAVRVVTYIKRYMDRFLEDHLDTLATKRGLHLDQEDVITLASIVEWETSVDREKAAVAGVYLNRLERGWPLQADPTVQYGLMKVEGAKRRLFYSDYRLKHPFNTYLFRGLPPGPITNPGRQSLEAAADPEHHDYMFFVASPEGGHAFNATLSGHNRDAARLRSYLRRRRANTSSVP